MTVEGTKDGRLYLAVQLGELLSRHRKSPWTRMRKDRWLASCKSLVDSVYDAEEENRKRDGLSIEDEDFLMELNGIAGDSDQSPLVDGRRRKGRR